MIEKKPKLPPKLKSKPVGEVVTSPPVFDRGRIIEIEGYNFRVKAVKETGYFIEPFAPITCLSCGGVVKSDDKFCGHCTKKLHKVHGLKYIRKPLERKEPKVGRNDKCSCGSGVKQKNCDCFPVLEPAEL